MNARDKLEARLKTFGIDPDPKVLDHYQVTMGPAGVLYAGNFMFYQDPECSRLQWEALVARDRDRPRPTTFDGRRIRSESGKLYLVSDPENPAEITIQRVLASYGLDSFDFRNWPAREEAGRIIVGGGIFEQTWLTKSSKSDVESFLRRISVAEPFRAKANETSVVSSVVENKPISGELQKWYAGIQLVGQAMVSHKSYSVESSLPALATTPIASPTENESSTT